ncbi:hypothetical protein Tco_1333134 [Tanacetum coccineum]
MKRVLNPTEVLLVVDAMTGQEAAGVPFQDQLNLELHCHTQLFCYSLADGFAANAKIFNYIQVKCTRANLVTVNNVTLDTADKDDVFGSRIRYNCLIQPGGLLKTRVDEDVVWLSNWPIGNILDAGDKVNVCIFEEEGLVVSVCGSSLEYTDDGKMEQEKNFEYNITGKEVIRGDLYEFQVTTGGATSETASKAAFDADDAAARYCFIYSRLFPPLKELVGGSKSEQLQKQKSLALKAVLDSLMQPKEQTKAMYSSTVISYTSPGEIALCGST